MTEFKLEAWDAKYIDDVAKYANNEKIAEKLRDAFPYPYTRADAEGYVMSCVKNGDASSLCRAIVVDGKAVGSVGVFLREDVYRKSAELGYWLGEQYWGQGIMSAAVTKLCGEAFERFDIVRIFAEPYAHNIGSRRVLEKSGFVLEGVMKKSVYKKGEIFDSCMYALVK